MDDVAVAVIVPERTNVDPALCRFDKIQSPGALRICGFSKIDTVIRVSVGNIKHIIMETNARRPYAIGRDRNIINIRGSLLIENMPDDSPVDQVIGVQDRQTGRAIETRRSHVIIATGPH